MHRASPLLALAALAPGLAACAAPVPVPASARLPSLGRPAAFSVPDERGDLLRVPAPAARATVVELWTTTCVPCRETLPGLAAEAPALARDGIALVLLGGLDEGEPLGAAQAALRSWGVDRGFLVDRGGGVQRALGASALPATIVLDRRGVVRWVAPLGARPETVAAAARGVARQALDDQSRSQK